MPRTTSPPAPERAASTASPQQQQPYREQRFLTEHERTARRLGPKPTRFAFGLEPDRAFFPLRLARYPAMAETIAAEAFDAQRSRPETLPLTLIDVGVGRGRSLQYTEPQGAADRVEWHGIDLDASRAHNQHAWASLNNGNVEDGMPHDDNTFDIAICEQVLEHLRDPSFVLREVRRVLKPNGLLIAGVPIFPAPIAAARRLLVPKDAAKHRIETGHPQTFSARSFSALVAGSGFAVQTVRGFRIISGGPLLRPLENRHWWYRFARAVGDAAPGLCVEVQVVARKAPP